MTQLLLCLKDSPEHRSFKDDSHCFCSGEAHDLVGRMNTQYGNTMQSSDFSDRDLHRELWPERGPNPVWEGPGKSSLRNDAKLSLEDDKEVGKSLTGRGSKGSTDTEVRNHRVKVIILRNFMLWEGRDVRQEREEVEDTVRSNGLHLLQ